MSFTMSNSKLWGGGLIVPSSMLDSDATASNSTLNLDVSTPNHMLDLDISAPRFLLGFGRELSPTLRLSVWLKGNSTPNLSYSKSELIIMILVTSC